jgi:hypothetical protein
VISWACLSFWGMEDGKKVFCLCMISCITLYSVLSLFYCECSPLSDMSCVASCDHWLIPLYCNSVQNFLISGVFHMMQQGIAALLTVALLQPHLQYCMKTNHVDLQAVELLLTGMTWLLAHSTHLTFWMTQSWLQANTVLCWHSHRTWSVSAWAYVTPLFFKAEDLVFYFTAKKTWHFFVKLWIALFL